MLFEVRCPGCGAARWCPCPSCVNKLAPPERFEVDDVASAAALFSYEGTGRQFIHALKFDGQRTVARWLADGIATAAVGPGQPKPTTVTWPPTTARNRRSRGFDQAELLARLTARRLRVPVRPLLRRCDSGSQTGRSRAERRAGPQFAPRRAVSCGQLTARPRAGVTAPTVLLVDDVVTTGATAQSAAAALHAAGAAQVKVVAAAHRASPNILCPPAAGVSATSTGAASTDGIGRRS